MVDIRLYQSPPGSGDNDGALPATYDARWQAYNNLTPKQVLAFQSFPQDLANYSGQRRWLAEVAAPPTSVSVVPAGGTVPVTIPLLTDDRAKTFMVGLRQGLDDGLITSIPFKDASGNWTNLDAAGIKAVHGAVFGFIAQLFAVENQAQAGINAKTITTRAQIDALIAAVAPNSPSAKGAG